MRKLTMTAGNTYLHAFSSYCSQPLSHTQAVYLFGCLSSSTSRTLDTDTRRHGDVAETYHCQWMETKSVKMHSRNSMAFCSPELITPSTYERLVSQQLECHSVVNIFFDVMQ